MESLYLPHKRILVAALIAAAMLRTDAALGSTKAADQAAAAAAAQSVEKQDEAPETPAAAETVTRVSGDQPGDDEPFEGTEFDSTWSSSEVRPLEEQPELLELTPGEVITVENSIERWVRELLQPFVQAEDYSVYVDVTMQADPYRLKSYRDKVDQLSLPGLPPVADEAGHPRENPLFSMIDKKKIILVFFKPVDPNQVSLITEILKAKRLIVEAKGDTLAINTAADPSLWERVQDIFSFFSFETEEGQPAWLGPMSSLVSVTMIFAFAVLIWQIVLLKKGGPAQRQIVVKGPRKPSRRPAPSHAAKAAASREPGRLRTILSSVGAALRGGTRAARTGAVHGKRTGQSAVRWLRRKVLRQVVPPVWPPKAIFDAVGARASSAAVDMPATRPAIQILPVGGSYSFRSISTMPKSVIGGALKGVDSRTLAVALINEDPDTIELVLANLPEERRDELVQQAIALDSSGSRDLGGDVLRARSRIAENLAVELHRSARA